MGSLKQNGNKDGLREGKIISKKNILELGGMFNACCFLFLLSVLEHRRWTFKNQLKTGRKKATMLSLLRSTRKPFRLTHKPSNSTPKITAIILIAPHHTTTSESFYSASPIARPQSQSNPTLLKRSEEKLWLVSRSSDLVRLLPLSSRPSSLKNLLMFEMSSKKLSTCSQTTTAM